MVRATARLKMWHNLNWAAARITVQTVPRTRGGEAEAWVGIGRGTRLVTGMLMDQFKLLGIGFTGIRDARVRVGSSAIP